MVEVTHCILPAVVRLLEEEYVQFHFHNEFETFGKGNSEIHTLSACRAKERKLPFHSGNNENFSFRFDVMNSLDQPKWNGYSILARIKCNHCIKVGMEGPSPQLKCTCFLFQLEWNRLFFINLKIYVF